MRAVDAFLAGWRDGGGRREMREKEERVMTVMTGGKLKIHPD